MVDMDSTRATTKSIATALVCHLPPLFEVKNCTKLNVKTFYAKFRTLFENVHLKCTPGTPFPDF